MTIPYRVIGLFLLLSLLLRLPSFCVSVIDHDESTYCVLANELWQGGTYLYKDWIDTKPPGIFLIFGAIIAIFGKQVVYIRLIGTVAVAFTATVLYLAQYRLHQHRPTALWTGIIYIMATAVHRAGLSVNTELFFNACTAAAWYVSIGWFIKTVPIESVAHKNSVLPKDLLRASLLGLLLGIGFVIKYVVLFDFVALCFLFVCLTMIPFFSSYGLSQSYLLDSPPITTTQFIDHIYRLAKIIALASLSFTVPFALCYTWFYIHGLAPYFYEAAFEITRRYPSQFDVGKTMAFIGQFLLSYFPLIIGAVLNWKYAFAQRQQLPNALLTVLALPIWLSFALLAAILPGKGFPHYLLQPLLPLVFFGVPTFLLSNEATKIGRTTLFTQKRPIANKYYPNIFYPRIIATTICIVIIGLNTYRFALKTDIPKDIARYLQPIVLPEDKMYSPAATILYFLLDKSPLTPYIHASLLTKPDHIQALQINTTDQFNAIIAQQPRFVVVRNEDIVPILNDYLLQTSQIVRQYDNGIQIWQCVP